MQTVNALLDSAFIGHLAPTALTAYGGATPIVFTLFSLCMALAMPGTALVSRAFGAKNPEEYKKACRQVLSVGLILSLIIGVISLAFSGHIAAALLPPDSAVAQELMSRYLHTYAFGLPAFMVIQCLAGALRGIGDTKSPMVISGIQIFLHILLNYMLIFPPGVFLGIHIPGANMGLMGASTALVISAWLAAIAYLIYTVRTPLGASWRIQMPERDWVVRILRIANPSVAMSLLRTGSFTLFTAILGNLPAGAIAVGAMRPAFAIESAMFMPGFGLSMAAAALVGQSLGMRRPDRAERLGWVAGHHAAMVTFAICVPIFIFAPNITSAMIVHSKEMANQAAYLLRALAVTEIWFVYAIVFSGAMQGAGDTVRPMWITLVGQWLLRLPLVYILAFPLGLGAIGAWVAMSASQAVQGGMAIWMWKIGRWKSVKV
ncbi:MAG: MATE family efflux transporter [Fimbriimonadaceae bacterium]|nr:MATE family efflux transporter [Fimbriimonadaceae bacterium]